MLHLLRQKLHKTSARNTVLYGHVYSRKSPQDTSYTTLSFEQIFFPEMPRQGPHDEMDLRATAPSSDFREFSLRSTSFRSR